MMEILVNLQLSNFSSLFEIAVTLNLIYVVAERAKQYGSTLTKNFFNTETNIEKKFNQRYSLIDKESVETMPAIVLGSGSTEGEIQKAKRDIHKLEDSKEARKKKLKAQMDNRCVLTSFSFVSFYMFFYSLFALFIGGLNIVPAVKVVYAIFTVISVIILIVISLFGERETPKWITTNLSLTKCCRVFLLVFILSVVIGICLMTVIAESLQGYWSSIILLSVVLPYMPFVIFMIIIHQRLRSLSLDLKKEMNEFENECKDVDAHIHQLKEAYELSLSMESDKAETSVKQQNPSVLSRDINQAGSRYHFYYRR